MNTNIKVRFSKKNNSRKNTLVTVREGDTIFFGVARCNVSHGEKFDRDEGLKKAAVRANVAMQNVASIDWAVDKSLVIHNSGLFGQVGVSDVKDLLSYFDNIDEHNRTGRPTF